MHFFTNLAFRLAFSLPLYAGFFYYQYTKWTYQEVQIDFLSAVVFTLMVAVVSDLFAETFNPYFTQDSST